VGRGKRDAASHMLLRRPTAWGMAAAAAAALHADSDLSALATWAPGKPVPFADSQV